MNLREYLTKNNISIAEFARRSGISPQEFSGYLRNKLNFGAKRALKIEKITNGEVSIKEILFPND